MTQTSGALIRAEDVAKQYRSGGRDLTVLSEVNLAVDPGEFIAIVGPSGSGKTTLLGLLAGLDLPSTGRIVVEDRDLASLTEDERAEFRIRRLGFVFQTFHLLPTLTARENVLVPLEIRGAPRGERESRARELLVRVGLEDRAHHYPAQLSGGEKQRVALARAFANDPAILLADEPTGNLDEETGGEVVDLIERLNREMGTTLVLVTHDPALAGRADRIVRLGHGRIVETEAARSVRG